MTKLYNSGAVEFQDRQLSFTGEFRYYIMSQLNSQKVPPKTIASVQRLFYEYDQSLGSLSIEEIADILTLLVFNFQSDGNRILADLYSAQSMDQETT